MVMFHLTTFLSAFLLFLVQPMEGNLLLPLFGGAPSVWVVTIVFYQAVLFVGYLAAHLLSTRCSRQIHLVVHLVILVIAGLLLQIKPELQGVESATTSPVESLFLLLLKSVGLPFFVLSMTSPLVQRWMSWIRADASVYGLYATSNAGSLVALIVYPLVCEPFLSLSSQIWGWSVLFILWAACCAWCVRVVWRGVVRMGEIKAIDDSESGFKRTTCSREVWFWVGLSVCSSMFLTSITNAMCNQLSALPFVFLMPLGVYLITFIIAFSSDGFRLTIRRGLIAVALVCGLFVLIAIHSSVFLQTAFVYSLLLGAVCLFCHITLYRSRPAAPQLTLFYVALSAGGAVGSLFVAVLAPIIFNRYYEIPLSFLLFGVLLARFMVLNLRFSTRSGIERATIIVLSVVFVLVIPLLTLSMVKPPPGRLLYEARNFFGKLSVSVAHSEDPEKELMVAHHGMTIHGAQRLWPAAVHDPIVYYSEGSGIWAAFHAFDDRASIRVGAIGLASGCLVAYRRGQGDLFRFYEINQTAIDIAQKQFTFLRDSEATSEIVLGDARVQLQQEVPQRYDLLVLDAFIGGAIPVHLLTADVFPTYLKHLQPGGLIAVHVSNHYLDLRPVIAADAEQFGLSFVTISAAKLDDFSTPSRWMVLSREREIFNRGPFLQLRQSGALVDGWKGRRVTWTDDFHNLLSIIMW